MSAVTIGKAWEKKCKGIVEDLGWRVEQANPRLRYFNGRVTTVNHDFFNAIDLWCIHKLDRPLLIQCMVGSNMAEKKRDVQAIEWNLHHMSVEIWRRIKDKRTLRVYTYGGVTALDGEHLWYQTDYNLRTVVKMAKEIKEGNAIHQQTRATGYSISGLGC